jgi:LPXTG-motif cell wall-anchored protein
MNVIYPEIIYKNGALLSGEDYLALDGDKISKGIAAATAGVAAAAPIVSSIASRGRRPLSEIEQKCGKKPLIKRGKKGKQWQQCADTYNAQQSTVVQQQQQQQQQQTSSNKTMLYVGVGLGVAALVGLVIYLKRKK